MSGPQTIKNVPKYQIGSNSTDSLASIVNSKRTKQSDAAVVFIDQFFKGKEDLINRLDLLPKDHVVFVPTNEEPTTDQVNELISQIRAKLDRSPCAVIGVGGGSTMDVAKAVSNLFTNPGCAEDFQGWDLVEQPGVFKIAVPTISGTGAEATRTCVMTNKSIPCAGRWR